MNDHLETSNEEHLRKTWSKLLKITKRLNELEAVEGQIEELQTDKKSMKRLLDGNSEEISDLKLSAKKLEVENMALKKDLASLQKQLEEVKLIATDDKEEVRSLKAEFKALKKDVEELRCKNVYPGEGAKSENDKVWDSKPVSETLQSGDGLCKRALWGKARKKWHDTYIQTCTIVGAEVGRKEFLQENRF